MTKKDIRKKIEQITTAFEYDDNDVDFIIRNIDDVDIAHKNELFKHAVNDNKIDIATIIYNSIKQNDSIKSFKEYIENDLIEYGNYYNFIIFKLLFEKFKINITQSIINKFIDLCKYDTEFCEYVEYLQKNKIQQRKEKLIRLNTTSN